MRECLLYYGDYRDVLGDVAADLIVTSPPYNIGSAQESRTGLRRLGLYDPKSYRAIRDYPDRLPEAVYQDEQAAFCLWCADHLAPNGVLVYNHKPRHRNGRLIHPGEWLLRPDVRQRLQLMEEIIWDRGSTHNHSNRLLWPQTERLYVFRLTSGTYPFVNHRQLTYRSDIWRITRSLDRAHNAPFPAALVEASIRAWSVPGALICDPYMGSGTTGQVAQACQRRFVGAEILAKYYHLACKRCGLTEEQAS